MNAVLNRLRGPDMDDHLNLMDDIDWTTTSLGSMDSWPQELATQIFLTMLVPNAQCLVLGEDKIVIYNQAYGDLIRDYHPRYFGKPVATWVEWAPYFLRMGAIYQKAETSGRAYVDPTFSMFMSNGGFQETVQFSCAVVCLPPPLSGFLGTFTETSATVANEKRHSILNELASSWKTAPNLDSLWDIFLESASQYPEVLPFAAIYTGTLPSESGHLSDSSGNDGEDFVYTLKGVTGNEDSSHVRVPQQFDLGCEPDPFTRHFLDARATRAPVSIAGDDIPVGWQEIAKSRGFGDACRGAVVCPSSTNRLSRVQAFLVLGLSTRDRWNESYQDWTSKLQREFSDIVASIISAQEAARKKRETARRARVEKELLNKEIKLRKREAELAAVRVERITKIVGSADVAIFERDTNGRLIFANVRYKLLTD